MWKSVAFFRDSARLPIGITTPTDLAGNVVFTASIAGTRSLSPETMIAVSNTLLIADWNNFMAMFTSVCFSSNVLYTALQLRHFLSFALKHPKTILTPTDCKADV